jgi:hypothetical protein
MQVTSLLAMDLVRRMDAMSLTVSPELQAKAEAGEVSDADMVECVRTSLPYAWSIVARTVDGVGGGLTAELEEEPPDEQARGQLLRLLGSDAMKGAVQRHFGIKLAFQNCCKVGVFKPGAEEQHAEFVSNRAQLLNQKPELVNC